VPTQWLIVGSVGNILCSSILRPFACTSQKTSFRTNAGAKLLMVNSEGRCQAVLIGLLLWSLLGATPCEHPFLRKWYMPLVWRRPIKTAWHRTSGSSINSFAPALVQKDNFCEALAKGRKILQRRIFWMEERLFYLLCTN
jgi:hypothetical protein